MGKYDPLGTYLLKRTEKQVVLSMQDIEKIIGEKLPQSAYKYEAWWSNSTTEQHSYSGAWTDNGYKTVDVYNTIFNEKIIFEKQQ